MSKPRASKALEISGPLAEAIHRLHQDADPEHLLVEAAKLARKAVKADEVALLLVDPTGRELIEHAVVGAQLRPSTFRMRVGAEGITGWVAGHGKTAIVPDVSKDSRYVQANSRVRSEAAVPILRGDRAVGVLNFESRKLGFFKDSDLPLLEYLASQIALGLHISEIAERSERLQARLELLHHLARLGNGFMAPDQFLNRVVDVLRRATGVFYASIFLGDTSRMEIVVLAHSSSRPIDIQLGATQKIGTGLIGTSFKLGETIHVRDVSKDRSYIARVPGVRSELCAPVRIGDLCLGVLDLQSQALSAFTPEDVVAVESAANLIAPVLREASTRYAAGQHPLSPR